MFCVVNATSTQNFCRPVSAIKRPSWIRVVAGTDLPLCSMTCLCTSSACKNARYILVIMAVKTANRPVNSHASFTSVEVRTLHRVTLNSRAETTEKKPLHVYTLISLAACERRDPRRGNAREVTTDAGTFTCTRSFRKK